MLLLHWKRRDKSKSIANLCDMQVQKWAGKEVTFVPFRSLAVFCMNLNFVYNKQVWSQRKMKSIRKLFFTFATHFKLSSFKMLIKAAAGRTFRRWKFTVIKATLNLKLWSVPWPEWINFQQGGNQSPRVDLRFWVCFSRYRYSCEMSHF